MNVFFVFVSCGSYTIAKCLMRKVVVPINNCAQTHVGPVREVKKSSMVVTCSGQRRSKQRPADVVSSDSMVRRQSIKMAELEA